MAGTQAVWGIDVGRCALKALKIRTADDGKVELVAHDYIEHAKILSQPDADRNELIGSALEKFLSRNDISKDKVVVSVPGQQTLSRFTKLPPVAPKRIPDIVRYEADQQIPFDMDEVIWDYQTFQQEGAPDLEVGIFAMKRELIREHLLHFEQASIEPIAVQAGPLAVYNAAHFDGMLGKQTTMLLDIGADNTDLIIATTDTLWTRTVPIGGNAFTEALVKSFKLSFPKAESLKRTAESSKYARQVFQAMRPVFADLVQELQRSIGFYSSTHRDAHIERVVCVGNACKLPGLPKYLQQNLGLPVERPEGYKRMVLPGSTGREFSEEFLSFAVAYGLALQGLVPTKVTSNLLPTEIAKQVVWRKKRPAFAAAAACLLLAGGLIWFRYYSDTRALAAGAAGPPFKVNNVDEAWGIIENGPGAVPARKGAEAVFAAGDFLKKELRKLAGQADGERAQTQDVVGIPRYKDIIPRIFQVIHESVPAEEGALGQAGTQTEVLKAIAAGAPRREQRKQVFIEKLLMQWEPDVNKYEWESLIEVPDPINDPNSTVPAIKIEITCRTPNQGALTFVNEAFMNKLRKNGRRPNTGFYFDRVFMFEGRKVETKGGAAGGTRPSTTPGATGGGGRGFGSTAPTGGGTAPPETGAAAHHEDVDPITLESTVNDWRFVIWIDAILENFPESEEADGESEGESEESEGD
jgi:type IV pilus assembly protein PilM